jgi:hypothetical protein
MDIVFRLDPLYNIGSRRRYLSSHVGSIECDSSKGTFLSSSMERSDHLDQKKAEFDLRLRAKIESCVS